MISFVLNNDGTVTDIFGEIKYPNGEIKEYLDGTI